MTNTLRVERAIRNISQWELAKAVEVTRQTINAIELMKYGPSLFLALRIADYFDKPVSDIFSLEEPERVKKS